MHPILIKVGDGFFIGSYGVLIAIGLMLGVWMASARAKSRGLNPDSFFDLAFVGVLSGFLFGRVTYIFLNFDGFMQDPGAYVFSRTGFVFLGGLVGGLISCWTFLKVKGLPILAVGDIAAPSIALTHAVGRIGCHFAGCCWGGVCNVPGLGIKLGPQTMSDGQTPFWNAYWEHLDSGLIEPSATQSLAVWPVQLMEAAGLFILVGLLVWFASKPRKAGQTLALYVIGYSVLRFMLEFLRGDAERGLWLGGLVSTSQILSLVLVPVGIAVLFYAHKFPISPYSHPSVAPKNDGDGDANSKKTSGSKN